MKRNAFTLIELLVVIAVISLLAAILFPVFLSVRAKGRQAVCTSNLRQIGLAVALYAQDADDVVPFGGDPIDMNTSVWQSYDAGLYSQQAQQLRPLPTILSPYTSSKDIWHCPADVGFDKPDFSAGFNLSANTSSFDEYGASYDYRTELAFRQVTLASLVAYDDFPPYAQHGASEINLLCDLSGKWHGSLDKQEERFNVLMCDGHVQNVTWDALDDVWQLKLDKPSP